MFEFIQLEQLLAIDKYKTLSKAAEELLISQPALSRSMQRLEEELQVTLFTRQKNKITFNENGKLALEYARKIVNSSLEMKEHLQAFDKSNHTISIGSCAPAPIWNLTPEVSRLFPDMKIQSDMKSLDELVDGLINNKYKIIITTDEMNLPDIISRKYCEEHLYISLPPAHPLAGHKSLTLNDLNGQSILILSKIGFWYDICKAKMPDSLFLVQEELSALDELRKSSALPSFATDLTNKSSSHDNRILIPLTDPEVNVTFYINYNKSYKKQFESIIYTSIDSK
ncbi:LysR family transcriptional regulator [Clostridium disporicum]|uniref:Transcriptional regulator n=1 Tax=Clostridium disporicum TaxID=84024 RepID=A0A174J0C7_9CLOT|nr:LysR family transcriptional regulator [Clostridium disporicum]CUO90625.1 Transcriptional regulator [Clostridium disporicum]